MPRAWFASFTGFLIEIAVWMAVFLVLTPRKYSIDGLDAMAALGFAIILSVTRAR